MAHLLPGLLRRGWDVRAFVFQHGGDGGPLVPWLEQQGVTVETASHHAPFAQRTRWLVDRCLAAHVQVIVPNYLVAGYAAGNVLRRRGIASIATAHSQDPFYEAVRSYCTDRPPEFLVDRAVVVSKALECEWNSPALHPVPVLRIPYGVPAAAATARFSNSPFHVAYVGRLTREQKRIDEVTHAFGRLVTNYHNLEAHIIGDGCDRALVHSIAHGITERNRLHLPGSLPVAEVHRRLPQFQALVLLSDYEGLPLALLEAMTAGVVPICRAIGGGVEELVVPDQSGILISTPDELDDAVGRLMASPERWQLLSEGAQKIARDFGEEACTERWSQLLEETIESVQERRAARGGVRRLPKPHPAFAWDDERSRQGWSPVMLSPLQITRRIVGRLTRKRSL